ncbi:hypothetical protein [Embleya sp. NPDC005575]|uniref:hypothetical protein n=1 Tax=Embleya sp. NPDC005575 TaxID=3156892 RepID=UPI0033B13474
MPARATRYPPSRRFSAPFRSRPGSRKIATTEQAIAALGQGGAAVIVGLPPTGSTARFDPLALVEADQRILGSNYGSVVAHRDIPVLVDLVVGGSLDVESMISARRPPEEAGDALAELNEGRALRQLLITGHRNLWPVPESALNVLPYVFVGALVVGIAGYAVLRVRDPQRGDRAGTFADDAA